MKLDKQIRLRLPNGRQWPLYWTVWTLLIILKLDYMGIEGEPVFHRRFHDDQQILNPPKHNFDVRNEDTAVAYLKLYGYLDVRKCQADALQADADVSAEASTAIPGSEPPGNHSVSTAGVTTDGTTAATPTTADDGRNTTDASGEGNVTTAEVMSGFMTLNEASTEDDGREGLTLMEQEASAEEETTEPPVTCSLARVAESVRHYQKAYQLDVTGIIDDATVQSMNQRRCGNDDENIEAALEEEESLSTTSPQPTSPPTPSPPTRRRRRARDLIDQRKKALKENADADEPYKDFYRNIREPAVFEKQNHHPRSMTYTDEEQEWLSSSSLARRLHQLREIKSMIEQENIQLPPVTERMSEDRVRHRRSTPVVDITSTGFNVADDSCVKWRLLSEGYSTRLPISAQRSVLALAFRMWSEVIPLKFCEETTGSVNNIHIAISFGRGVHMNCPVAFDGDGGALAHSWALGDIHLDDEENYVATPRDNGVMLLRVVVHEIGHVIGLSHTSRFYSIMYAIYSSPETPQLELGWEDRKDVQNIYGCCKGDFNVVFDWIRAYGDSYIYNTYFFRKTTYWMYENRYNRTRYGDPLPISSGWSRKLVNVDSYAQAFYSLDEGETVTSDTYFFKGPYFYKYDNENDRIYPGYPKSIALEFGPRDGQSTRIPNNIDAAFFHRVDGMLYFFKGTMVYALNYDRWLNSPQSEGGCCDFVGSFSSIFPNSPGSSPALTGNIDSAYYSRVNYRMYFFKGERYWENIGVKNNSNNELVYRGMWWEKWFDICEVS